MVDFDIIWIFLIQICNLSKLKLWWPIVEKLRHHYSTNFGKFTQSHTTQSIYKKRLWKLNHGFILDDLTLWRNKLEKCSGRIEWWRNHYLWCHHPMMTKYFSCIINIHIMSKSTIWHHVKFWDIRGSVNSQRYVERCENHITNILLIF